MLDSFHSYFLPGCLFLTSMYVPSSSHEKKNLNKWFVDSRFAGFELICTMNRVRYSDDDDDGGGNNKRNLYSRKNGW